MMPKRARIRRPVRSFARRSPTSPTVEVVEARLLMAILTVNTAADDTIPDGTLSLREAIEVANGTLPVTSLSPREQAQVGGALSNPNTIDFHIADGGVQTIQVLESLPAITSPLLIDGYTEPGSSPNILPAANNAVLQVQLSGNGEFSGLTISAGGCHVRGLVVNGFNYGIAIMAGTGSSVAGDFLGTNPTGTVAVPNSGYGVYISSDGNLVGGAAASEHNLISGNGQGGVLVASADLFAATGNVISGNFIGTNAAGSLPLANLGDGVDLQVGNGGNTVGGAASGSGNLISGNLGDGVLITTPGNTLQGNNIGTDSSGTLPLGNSVDGVRILQSDNNTILANAIDFNGSNGVTIGANLQDTSQNDRIDGNTIFGNARLGIDLGDDGVTPNTPGGPHAGPDHLQNYPVLTSAMLYGTHTILTGTLDGGSNGPFIVQVFQADPPDPSGHGQGTVYYGQSGTNVPNTLDILAKAGSFLTSTAIDASGNTSEFSNDIQVIDALQVTNTNDSGTGSLRQVILNANANPGIDTITFNIPGAGVHVIAPTSPLPAVTDPAIIDASTQPGYAGTPLVVVDGTDAGANADGLDILAGDSTLRGLAIGHFGGVGLYLSGGGGDRIVGNYVGLAPDGVTPLGNFLGIYAGSASDTIGGVAPGDGNVLSGNDQYQLTLGGPGGRVQGNLIGTNATGTAAVASTGPDNGIQVGGYDLSDILIGGTDAGDRNVISGNGGSGIIIGPASGPNPGAVVVQGNFIGTDITGLRALGNQQNGIFVLTQGVLIGGTDAGDRNVISGNGGSGIIIAPASGPNPGAVVVQGNFIGTDITGLRALGNQQNGIFVLIHGVLIGGTTPGAGNLISGNKGNGVRLLTSDPGTTFGDLLQGNFIGTGAGGAGNLGNFLDGVFVDTVEIAQIGGFSDGAGNTIAYNGGAGVFVNTIAGATILSNSIHDNAKLGIDIAPAGVTPNGPAPIGEGSNGTQNFPVLTATASNGLFTTIVGTITGTINTPIAIQLFANVTPDPSGYGQGQMLLGSTGVTTDRLGNASFRFDIPTALVAGKFLSATATNSSGTTSEFSRDLFAVSPGSLQFSAPTYTVFEAGGTTFANVTVVRTDGGDGQVSVNYATSDGNATAGIDYTATSGTLTFAPGELSQTFQVAILDTLLLTGTRSFVVALSSPQGGASVGSRATAVVTIVEASNLVVTNTADDGNGSLRRAINLVNNPLNSGPFAITFAIPGGGVRAIRPLSPLPILVAPVVIDGYSQPGTRPNDLAVGDDATISILLDGGALPPADADSGLVFAASGNVVQGLAIGGFPIAGIVLEAGVGSRVQGNFLGTDASGTRAFPNGRDGIYAVNSSYNYLGGTTPDARNIISGNGSVGVVIQGNAALSGGFATTEATSNVLANNYIGTDRTGSVPLGNAQDGVFLVTATGNTIGLPAAGNLISGNGSVGIQILGVGASSTQIFGNIVGLDATGRNRLGNAADGIFVQDATGTMIGGAGGGQGNTIAGNGSVGVQVFGTGASGNVIQGNLIGTDSLGLAGLGNRKDGVYLNKAPGNLVGGSIPGQGNIISGNGFSGVEILLATGNVVQGNLIGIAPGGGALGNDAFGVLIQDASGNTVGGAGGARNAISANGFAGIQVLQGGQLPTGSGGAGNALTGNLFSNNNLRNGAPIPATVGAHPKGARHLVRAVRRRA